MLSVAIYLFVIAVVAYAAFPLKTPEDPLRLMYTTNVGNVLFNHQLHTADTGFGLDCFDCHHHPYDDDMALVACGQCHPKAPEKDVVPEYCLECHDEDEVEDTIKVKDESEKKGEEEEPGYPNKRSDAIHRQCTQCHLEFGKGGLYKDALNKEEQAKLKTQPNEWVDCNKCHLKQ